MTWSDVTADWGRWFQHMKTRFPNLDDSAMPFLKQDRGRFEAYLADTHHLSLIEAREEFEDFLFVETLVQDA
ncbi:MAG: hypothetical protein KDK29_00210 [Sedimentitalea sp.]|nr:hypothetical protein [Sedimentitalea sp.]